MQCIEKEKQKNTNDDDEIFKIVKLLLGVQRSCARLRTTELTILYIFRFFCGFKALKFALLKCHTFGV